MAIQVAGDANSIARALLTSYKALRADVATGLSKVHADITSLPTSGGWRYPTAAPYIITAADPTDLATLAVSCRDIYRVYTTHIADTSAHKIADTVNTIAFGLPVVGETLANLIIFVNQAKASHNAHRSQSGVHPFTDSGNATAAATATDLASALTMAIELKVDINAHIQTALASPGVVLIGE